MKKMEKMEKMKPKASPLRILKECDKILSRFVKEIERRQHQ